MADCLICTNSIEPVQDFGRMPIANGFLRPEQVADEFFFDLKIGF